MDRWLSLALTRVGGAEESETEIEIEQPGAHQMAPCRILTVLLMEVAYRVR